MERLKSEIWNWWTAGTDEEIKKKEKIKADDAELG